MAIFGKKEPKVSSPAPEKKKKASDLSKVLDESVWERALEDFKANKGFITKDADGETVYVGLLFDTTQVGGLAGKNARRDESKGSIIEAIRTGRIKTYLRTEMLCDDCILIIPDKDTIENMDEFNILSSSEYSLCTIDVDGNLVALTSDGTDDGPELTVKFSSVKDCVLNGKTFNDLKQFAYAGSVYSGNSVTAPDMTPSADDLFNAGSSGSVFGDVVPEEAQPLDEDIEDLPDDMAEEDDDPFGANAPVAQSAPVKTTKPVEQPDTSDAFDSEDLADDFGTSGDDFADLDGSMTDPVDAGVNMAAAVAAAPAAPAQANNMADSSILGYDDAPEDEAEPMTYYSDVTAEFMNNYVVHKFYSDDLGLEVSTQPFDTKFLHANPYIPFNENRGDGWLNEYLSNFSKDANIRMERLHNENLYRLRDKYMRIIRSNCEAIAKRLDSQDISNQYGRIKEAIEHVKADNIEHLPQLIAERREALDKEWYDEMNRAAETAANKERAAYESRTRATHNRAIEAIEHDARDEIEREYSNAMRRMNEDRRAEAGKLLDLAVGEALKEMDKLYEKVLASEQKEYLRLQNEMTRFIDDNRKDEKIRIDVLAEENRQVKRANEVRKEYLAKIRIMNAEFDAKKSALQADIDRMNREHNEELRNYENDWSSRVSDEKARAAELESRIDDLLKQYADLDAKKTSEFEARINELKAENEAKDDNIEHIITTHKRSNLISIFLVVAILIAAIGIGFMVGSLVNIRNTSAIEQDSVYQSYQTNLPDDEDEDDDKSESDLASKVDDALTGRAQD